MLIEFFTYSIPKLLFEICVFIFFLRKTFGLILALQRCYSLSWKFYVLFWADNEVKKTLTLKILIIQWSFFTNATCFYIQICSGKCPQHPCQRGLEYSIPKESAPTPKLCPSVTLNHVWLWCSTSGDLESMQKLFIAINFSSTLTRSGSTC